jgi:predicted nucleotidyltransferase
MERKEIAEQIATKMIEQIESYGFQVIVVGSLRRGSTEPKDVDLLVVAWEKEEIEKCSRLLKEHFGNRAHLVESYEPDLGWVRHVDRVSDQMETDIFYIGLDSHWFPPQIYFS